MLLAGGAVTSGRCANRPLSTGGAPNTLNLQVYCMPAGCPDKSYTRSGHFCWSNALDSVLGSSSKEDVVGGWTAEGRCGSSVGGHKRYTECLQKLPWPANQSLSEQHSCPAVPPMFS